MADSLDQQLRALVRDVPDFPKPGILYYDIASLLINGKAFSETIKKLCMILMLIL